MNDPSRNSHYLTLTSADKSVLNNSAEINLFYEVSASPASECKQNY